MCREWIHLTCFIALLGLPHANVANAADSHLVGWWKLDETSGIVAHDSSGYGNDGILFGDPQWGGGGLVFDGDGDYVDCGDGPSLNIAGSVTITGWIRLDGPGDDRKIAGNQDGTTGGYKLGVYGNRLEFEIRTADNVATLNRSVGGGMLLEPGVYHHVAGVYSQGDYIRTYVDGVLDRELSTAELLGTSTGTFKLGREPFSDSYFWLGFMDDVRVYGRALSQGEIQALAAPTLKTHNPNPPNGATDVSTPLLTWESGGDVVCYNVYLGTSPILTEADLVAACVPTLIYFHPPGFEPGVTYYWRVDGIDAYGTTCTGTVWSFTVGRGGEPIPVAWWRFDEGEGSVASDSVGTAHAAVEGATWAPGHTGLALHFDGVDDVVTTPLNIDQTEHSSGATFCAWVYPGPVKPGRHQVVSSDDGGYDWSILYEGNGNWHVFTGNNSEDTGLSVDVERWQFVAAVFEPGIGITFYKDEDKFFHPFIDYDPSNNNIAIGGNPGSWNEFFVGRIDEVLIYNYALSPEEMKKLLAPIPCVSSVCEAIYDTLIDIDLEGNLVPGLVSAWEIIDDGEEIILHLREGVLFHNGEQLDSDAVLRNLAAPAFLFREFHRAPLLGSGLTGEAEAIDTYTVGMRTGDLCAFQILSRLAGPAGMLIAPAALEVQMREPIDEPVGCGPYALMESDGESFARLERFPEYWRRLSAPELIEIVVIPREVDRLDALMNHDVHVMVGFDEEIYADLTCATDFDVYGRPREYQAVSKTITRWSYYGDRRLRLSEAEFDGVLRVAVDGLLVCRPEDPRILLTDSSGEETNEFILLDTVYGAFSRLVPDTDYEIRVRRSDGGRLYALNAKSGTDGLIPSVALLWDLGVEYGEGRAGELNVEGASLYTYTCEILRGGILLAVADFSIKDLRDSPPILFASDEWGNPKNGFEGSEDVYVTGINFPAGSTVRLYPVPAQYSWSVADPLNSVTGGWATAYPSTSTRSFTERIWYASNSVPGVYDVVGEWIAHDGYYSPMDAIDGAYGVGFTVIDSGNGLAYHLAGGIGIASHVEVEVACKQPPLTAGGAVKGAPNPIYKNYYALAEPIWAAVNPTAGGGNYANKTARIYVVKDKTSWNDGDQLTDVSGGYDTVVIQPGCANVNYHPIWPNASGGSYDVIVDFSPFKVYNDGTDIVDHVTVQGFIVPDPSIALAEIRFNRNTTSATDDALNIRRDNSIGGDIVPPEWVPGKVPLPAAYTANNGVDIQVTLAAATWVKSAQIQAVEKTGNLGTLSYQTVNFNNGKATILMHLTTPAAVDRFMQTWDWWYRNVDGLTTTPENFATSANRIYILLGEPTLPWTGAGVTKVWTRVLDWSCDWAKGQTTYADAAGAVAHKLWDSSVTGGEYDFGSKYTGPEAEAFKLTNFLNNMPVIKKVNCYDMSKSCVTFGSALGCNLNHHYTDSWGYMKCVKAIGSPWNCSQGFGNHAFGMMGSMIFDACMAVDGDSDPINAPPALFTWLTNISWTTYQSLVMLPNNTPGTPTQYAYTVY